MSVLLKTSQQAQDGLVYAKSPRHQTMTNFLIVSAPPGTEPQTNPSGTPWSALVRLLWAAGPFVEAGKNYRPAVVSM